MYELMGQHFHQTLKIKEKRYPGMRFVVDLLIQEEKYRACCNNPIVR